jgi:HTH-type transcriptional regulator/antitoxin HigA
METDPELGTSEGDRLDAMVNLVQTYEALYYPLS